MIDLLKGVRREAILSVIQVLESLPDKRLSAGVLWDHWAQCGCLLGAIYPGSVTLKATSLVTSVAGGGWSWIADPQIAKWGADIDLTPEEAASLQALNDSTHLSVEDRYKEVLRVLKGAVSDDT